MITSIFLVCQLSEGTISNQPCWQAYQILHGRNLVTRKAISVDLIALQAKYIKSHDKARPARSQRALVIGEEVYYLTAGNNWVIGTVSGTRNPGRSYDILTQCGTSLRRNRSHLKPWSHDIPMLNQYFSCWTTTPCQSEIFHSGPAHPPKEKYTTHNNHSLSGPVHPPKEKYSQSVWKLVIKCMGNTVYDSYIAETLTPLSSAFKPRKQTRFESDPMTSVRHIPARCSKETSPPKRTFNPVDPHLLIQATMGVCVQDLGELEAGEAYDTSKDHTPPPHHVAKSKLKGVTTANVTALLIAGPSYPPKVKYLKQVTMTATITVSGPSHPPKVKYSLKLQIPAQLKLVQRQTGRNFIHNPQVTVR